MAVRMYGLFRKVEGKWVPAANGAYPKSTAIRIFQNQLLSFTGCTLRPVKQESSSKIPANEVLCTACLVHTHDNCLAGDCACGCRLRARI